jgi:single-strand DNA-binding protein
MSDLNRVTLVGRLTRDPEVRHTSAGMPITQLGLAVNGRQKNTAGEWVEKPNYVDVKLFGERFERLAPHLTKGSRIGIDGRLEWSSWESDGVKRSKVEVVAQDVQLLDGKREDHTANPAANPAANPTAAIAQAFPGATVSDDSIPF